MKSKFLASGILFLFLFSSLFSQETMASSEEYSQTEEVSQTEEDFYDSGKDATWLENVHYYSGYATVILGLTTFLIHPDEDGSGLPEEPHIVAGYATAGFAAITITSGLFAHMDSVGKGSGIIDVDNLHFLLGVAGAASMLTTAFLAPDEPHAPFGVAGTALMGTAILLRWQKFF